MKKQATALAVGALFTIAMSAPSFAAQSNHAAHQARAKAANPYAGYYDTNVAPRGYDSYTTGGDSGSMGGIGR